ncbi:MAG: glycosidase [Verrucomicrobiota bacterium]
MKLKKYDKNPILSPLPGSSWESACTCNPAAWYDGKKVLLLYRAGPDDDVHRIYVGLAQSKDGFTFRRVGKKPVFGPSENGFDGGCIEDPRIVKMGEVYFLTYAARLTPPGPYWRKTIPLNAYIPDYLKNGPAPVAARWNLTRSGLAASRDLRKWVRLGPITDASVDNRDVIIFPEQVQGRFVMLHRPGSWTGPKYGCEKPSMWISFSDDLLAWPEHHLLAQPVFPWEGHKIGGSTPPLKTAQGWLTLYHGVDDAFTYRAGAMMLDLNDPHRVIARTPEPILEPETECERNGLVNNVVFPCGNVVIGDTLFVYYGAADKYCCVATAPLAQLVDYVMSHPWKG